MKLMVVTLSTDLEKLVADRIARGEFENAEAVVEFALRRFLDSEQPVSPLNSEERAQALMEFFEEVDRDLIDAPPVSDEALSRRNLYDDRRNRL
jgi:Arc/MetJ-type ribon-helix-helix transcriptional regulator